MTDNNNSKMLPQKMLSQKVCRCGNAVADILDRTDRVSENLRKVKFGESTHILAAYEELVNYVYVGITNVESFCDIDAREEQLCSMDAFSRISEMRATKDLTTFRHRKDEILDDLSKIKSGIKEKIKDCSYP